MSLGYRYIDAYPAVAAWVLKGAAERGNSGRSYSMSNHSVGGILTYSGFLLPREDSIMANFSNHTWNNATAGTSTPSTSGAGSLGAERLIVPAVFSVVVLLGCLGNTLVIMVVVRNNDQFRNTTNLFILNLAVADLLFLVFCVPFHAVIYTVGDWPFGQFMCKFVHLIQYLGMVTSILTMMAMSLDRYLAIGHPLRTKHLRTPCVALLVCIVTWIVSVGVASPGPIVYTVRVHTVEGHSQVVCADDWGAMSHLKRTYYLVLFIFAYAIPLVAIFVLSVLMIHQLWAVNCPPSEGGVRHRRSLVAKRKVTRLIVVVVLVFGICWLPSHISWLWTNYWPQAVPMTYAFYYWRIASHVLSYANSSMNPVIYAFLSSQFRKGFRRALRGKGKDGHRESRSPATKSMYSERVPSSMTEATVWQRRV